MLPRNRFLRSPEGVIVTAILLFFALYYLMQEQEGALSWRVQTLDDLPDGGVVLVNNGMFRVQEYSPALSLQDYDLAFNSEVSETRTTNTGQPNSSAAYTTAAPSNNTVRWPCGINPSNVSYLAEVAKFSMRCDVANDVAEKLGNLILNLTQIERADYMGQLRHQLCGTSKSMLEKLWRQLSEFVSTHACEGCADTRPPPRTALPPTARLLPLASQKKSWNGTRLPLIALQPEGRLGNQMGEYATLLALHRIYKLPVFLTADMHANLSTAFPRISFPALPQNATASGNWTVLGKDGGCAVRRYRGLELAAAGFFGPQLFLVAAYPFEMHLFNAFRRQILREFKFHPKIVAKARARLRNFTEQATAVGGGEQSPLVRVGVHVRLSDYPGFMKREFQVAGLLPAYHGYLRRAVSYFQRRHDNVAYVVTSDDVYNTSLIFDSIGARNVFISNGTASEDLCLLSLCQHNIVTFGTFGFWAGYLSGGTTLYPHLQYPDAQYMLTRELYRAARVSKFVPISFYSK